MDKMKKNRIGHNCKKLIVHNWRLYVLMLPALAWLIIFAYYPMYGLLISFKDYKGTLGILGSPWATPLWKHFAAFFSTSIAKNVIVNTLVLSLLTMLFSDSDSLCTFIESDTRKKKKKICTDNFVCTVFCIKRSSCQHSECNLRTEWICKYNHSVIDRKTAAFNVISTVFSDNVYRF